MQSEKRPLFAVLIDGDNISAKYAEPILKEIDTFSNPALRRVYGDWSRPDLKNWAKKILEFGLTAHQETANTKGKNATDIGLVIDAMDILHSGKFDGIVLVSSDSDFTRLAARIREDGLEVVGIGEAKMPESLRNVCNRVIFIENIVGDLGDTEVVVTTGDQPKEESVKKPISKAVPLIVAAMDRLDPDGQVYHLGQLGQAITALYPDFDCRTYGKKKLSDLILSLDQFSIKREGTVLQAVRKT